MRYSKYPSYRDSGIEWLGKVPLEWDIKPFWTLYKRDKKTGYPNEILLSVYRDYGVIQKSSRDDNNNKASEDLSAYQLVNPSDLAMNKMKAWQGSLGVSEYRGIVSPAYFVFESLHNEYDQYLHHLMRSPRYIAGYLSMSKGIRVNQWDLDPQYHSRMPIILPPYQEQQAIANYLDKATAKIDTLIEKQTKLIELLREKRQAVISTAVTRGLDNTVAMKDSGVEWLGNIPEHWKVKKLKYSLSLQTEKQKIEKQDVIALENIEGWSGKYVKTDSSYQGDDVAFQEGDILFGKLRPYLAKVYQAENSGIAFGDILVYRPNKDTDSGYAFYSMISEAFIDIVDGSTYGSKMPRASVEFVSNMPIGIAPKQEQKQIAKYLNETILKIEALITKSTKAIDLLKEKRIALISAAVTGKIDVREIA